ncbi:methyltransferase [Rhodococcus sp. 1163]|uniref:O-methyltransferase n=1 Tax=unclassified Rhodococcus (in: high G+C Gram-positive bacteria) TaxID=192944 RepID=UPI000A0B8959|nr:MULTISPECIES: O-methyltransferase [unclassified Rhodococcus (in: high G+C Gram-positive bacteria)]MDJ0358713.1 O-methyltransferase [Rhodococcus sp. H29-C3]ORI17707.1 methyltransferase [Rhodococcus sp. 1163]
MLTNAEKLLTYAEESVQEDEILVNARERADDLGAAPVPPSVGAVLSIFAQMLGAKTVVEVGTGAGVSGLWLLDGMREDGVLTTIDTEPEHQRAAKEAFRAGGIAPSRTRLINGWALDVLPRLADDTYDLVFIDTSPVDHLHFVQESVRLLRPGGVLVLHNALLGGRVPDSTQRDATTVAVRAAARAIAEDDRLTTVLLPLGDGLICASRS